MALIHVEIEIRAHHQMLQILNQEREDTNNRWFLLDVRQEETIGSVLKILQNGSPKGTVFPRIIAIPRRIASLLNNRLPPPPF